MLSVSVLMYHHVLQKSGFITSSIEEFRAQMNFLASNGYKTLSSAEFFKFKKGELKLPKKSVFITFDDGWKDNFIYAYPIIKEFGLRATIFLTTQWVEKASQKLGNFIECNHDEYKKLAPKMPENVFLNYNEIEKMRENFDFHSHTHTHFNDYFGEISLNENISLCKKFMKDKFGIDDNMLCWPKGVYNDEYIKVAKQNGYEMLFTTKRGINKADNKLDEIKRIAVKKDDRWLKKTLFIYQSDILGSVYSWIKR